MSATSQNCGSCRWWTGSMRWCGLPMVAKPDLPASAAPLSGLWDFRRMMSATEGTTCPTYAPREGGEETRS